MSKDNEFDILNELEKVVNEAGSSITDEWKALQIRLLQESREVSEQVFDNDNEVKAVLCVGYQINEDEFNDEHDGVERIGPDKDEYFGINGGTGYARMAPAVGVKSAMDMHKFLRDKTLVCSLYERTSYVSLLIHTKYKQSELMAMTTPVGLAVQVKRKDKDDVTFYLMFENEVDANVNKCMKMLTDKQRSLLMEMCEAQVIPSHMKNSQGKMWEMMIEAIKEYKSNPFLDDTKGDE